ASRPRMLPRPASICAVITRLPGSMASSTVTEPVSEGPKVDEIGAVIVAAEALAASPSASRNARGARSEMRDRRRYNMSNSVTRRARRAADERGGRDAADSPCADVVEEDQKSQRIFSRPAFPSG